MPCSAVTLSIATICAIIATALLAIAFSTDNWLHYDVRRNQIQVSVKRQQNDGRRSSHISRISHLPSRLCMHMHVRVCIYICMNLAPPPKSKTIGSNRAKAFDATVVVENPNSRTQVVIEEEGRAKVKKDVGMRR